MQTITNLEKQPANMSKTAQTKMNDQNNDQTLGSVIAARSAKRLADAKTQTGVETDTVETSRIIIPAIVISAAFAMALLWDEMIIAAFGA